MSRCTMPCRLDHLAEVPDIVTGVHTLFPGDTDASSG
jgi:hypothetical protein